MKKILLCTATLAMLSGSSLLAGVNANAATNKNFSFQNNTINSGDANNGEESSSTSANGNPNNVTKTSLTIDNSNTSVSPFDPTNPGNPGNPTTNDTNHVSPTNAKGDLTLDAIPTSLIFPSVGGRDGQNIKDILYNNDITFTQVSDNRGTNSGWTLTATMSDMKNSKDDTLNGANIEFKSANVPSTKATGAYKNANKNDSTNPETSNFTLDPRQGPINVMTAQSGQGMGTWADKLNNVTLQAEQSKPGTYDGSITWVLTSNLSSNGIGSNYDNPTNNHTISK